MLTRGMRLRLHRARQLLADPDASQLALADVAAQAGMSPFHFIRRFAAVFGDTPHQYRIRMRLERARQLLALGEGSVTQVALSVGFESPAGFSTAFCRRFGEPPSAFRRRLLPALAAPGRMPPLLVPGCLALMTAAWSSPQFLQSASERSAAQCRSPSHHRSKP